MKGCDKKNLKLELLRNFPVLTAEDIKEIIPTKEDLNQVKIVTHSGESLHLYCVGKLPVLFCRENRLYPTVYLLWRFPHLIPFFTTAPEVVPVLQGGADFMAAGIISPVDNQRYGKVAKNDIVYLNLINNKAAAVVGEAALSSHDMYMSGGRGKCVIVLHVYEDELYKFGTVVPLPQLGPVFVDTLPDEPSTDEKVSYARAVKLADDQTGEITLNKLKVSEETESNLMLNTDDDVLMYCFLKALNTSMKNVKLPLLISNFYKLHMISCCPKGKSIDIKKTKYKKMSKFMQEMANSGIVRIEEPSPGVQSIVFINFSHYLVSGFIDHYPTAHDEEQTIREPKVCEKYSVTAAVLPLFSEFLFKKGESMTVSEARKYTAEYIRKYKLPLQDDPSMVRLDPVLKIIIAQGVTDEVPDVVKWEEVMNRVLQKMSKTFKITNKNAVFAQKEKKGKLPLIDIHVANKAGNKKVTLVNNLEAYGINIEEFSRECQKGVAASATINQINGMKGSQLQIQGNQVNFLEKILTDDMMLNYFKIVC